MDAATLAQFGPRIDRARELTDDIELHRVVRDSIRSEGGDFKLEAVVFRANGKQQFLLGNRTGEETTQSIRQLLIDELGMSIEKLSDELAAL